MTHLPQLDYQTPPRDILKPQHPWVYVGRRVSKWIIVFGLCLLVISCLPPFGILLFWPSLLVIIAGVVLRFFCPPE